MARTFIFITFLTNAFKILILFMHKFFICYLWAKLIRYISFNELEFLCVCY